MDRRHFGKTVAMGTGGLLMSSVGIHTSGTSTSQKEKIKAAPLNPGDTVGLIAPASSFDSKRYERAVENISKCGFRLLEGRYLHRQKGYLAGTDRERLYDLHDMFRNPKVRGIWCLRGGYGTTRLLEKIDYRLLRENPKVFAGFSDITALLNAFSLKSGLVGFHSPVAASELTDYNKNHFLPLISGQSEFPMKLESAKDQGENRRGRTEFRTFTISGGRATGKLTGGNLSLLASLCGTPYLGSFKDRIVFIEDVGEKPYKIDRMLTQLLQATDLKSAAGIAFGICNACDKEKGSRSLSLEETLRDRIEKLEIPAVYGLSFGHIKNQFTLPVGIEAELDADRKWLHLLESPVKT